MGGFGEDIERAARDLDKVLPEGGRDWLVDAAIFLALAYASLKRHERSGGLLRLANKLIVLPAIERAWQELIHIRVRHRPETDVPRDITITSVGRVVYERNVTNILDGRCDSDRAGVNQGWQGDAGSRTAERYRARRDRKRGRAETSGDHG